MNGPRLPEEAPGLRPVVFTNGCSGVAIETCRLQFGDEFLFSEKTLGLARELGEHKAFTGHRRGLCPSVWRENVKTNSAAPGRATRAASATARRNAAPVGARFRIPCATTKSMLRLATGRLSIDASTRRRRPVSPSPPRERRQRGASAATGQRPARPSRGGPVARRSGRPRSRCRGGVRRRCRRAPLPQNSGARHWVGTSRNQRRRPAGSTGIRSRAPVPPSCDVQPHPGGNCGQGCGESQWDLRQSGPGR